MLFFMDLFNGDSKTADESLKEEEKKESESSIKTLKAIERL